MKNLIINIVIAAILLSACNTDSKSSIENKKNDSTTIGSTAAKSSVSIKEVTEHYLHIKNALANDDGNEAAAGGKAFVAALANLDKSLLTAEQKNVYTDIEPDAIEMADHISTNANKIAHQREHFDMLSNDLYDILKAFGTEQTLYQDFCPMYNDKKGATWLSETKEIKNPYMGKKMATCGIVKEEIK